MNPLGPTAVFLLELGGVIVALGVLGRIASRLGISPVPLYLVGGLAFGRGGILPLRAAAEAVRLGSELGVVLLLFLLGLEYTGSDLRRSLRTSFRAGVVDFLANATPGVAAGLLLGLDRLSAAALGGVTYVSSSGIAAKLLGDLHWKRLPEAKRVTALLVLEDVVMAIALPALAAAGLGAADGGLARIAVSLGAVVVAFMLALRWGATLARFVRHESEEVVLLTLFGALLVVAGGAEATGISAAVGALLLGVAVAGPLAVQARTLLAPLRDLFAGLFFLFFGLSTDPRALPPVLVPALILAAVTAATKLATGAWTARRAGVTGAGRWRAGVALVPRGEFSIVLAGLATATDPASSLGPLAAAYVLILAIVAPLAARLPALAVAATSEAPEAAAP